MLSRTVQRATRLHPSKEDEKFLCVLDWGRNFIFSFFSITVFFLSNLKLLNIVFSLFHWEVAENCALLSYHAANSDDFRTEFSGQPIKKPEDGTDSMSRNVCKKLPLLSA